MTIEGVIVQLQELIDNDGIPFWAKPSLQKIKETVEMERKQHIEERNNNSDRVSRNDVISICNILGDKMDDEGRVAVEQVRDAVKDMRPYPYKKTCRYCTNGYDSEECYECTNNIQDVYIPPKEDDKCEKCNKCDYYNCPDCGTKMEGDE